MKILKTIKNLIYKSDLFYTSELLRYKTEPQHRTIFGGFMSILLIVGLTLTFYNKLIETLDKVVITCDQSNRNAADPTPYNISTFSQNHFMFGVQIFNHDLNSGKRFFDVILTSIANENGSLTDQSKAYSLEPCTLDHWEAIPEIQKDFKRLRMNYWLCLPKNMKFNIQGKYSSSFLQTLQVTVMRCTNESNPQRPCAAPSQIDNFFAQNGQMFFTIYFINPLINPTNQKYLSFYLEDNNYVIFTDKYGAGGVLFMEEYEISTDESILPFNQIKKQAGGIVREFALKNPFLIDNSNPVYCSFAFFKSGTKIVYDRKFQRLDETLSYIGGLFGTITICLFIIKMYNQASFQINLGSQILQPKHDENDSNNLKKYNFISFLVHGVFKLIKKLGCQPNWKSFKQFDECKEEMVRQLDIVYLIKRIMFLEKVVLNLMQQHQLKGLHLQDKLTLEEVKKNRQKFKLKRKLFRLKNKIAQKSAINSPNSNLDSNLVGSNSKVINSCHIQNIGDSTKNKQKSNQKQNVERQRKRRNQSLDSNLTPTEPYYSNQSSQSSSQEQTNEQNDSQLILELQKLKQQAGIEQNLSQNIWSNFNKKVQKNIENIINQTQIISDPLRQENQVISEEGSFSRIYITSQLKENIQKSQILQKKSPIHRKTRSAYKKRPSKFRNQPDQILEINNKFSVIQNFGNLDKKDHNQTPKSQKSALVFSQF